MNRRSDRRRRGFKAYIRRTFANKVVAIVMMLIGLASMTIDRDATMLAFTLIIGIPLFFTRKDYIYCLGRAA